MLMKPANSIIGHVGAEVVPLCFRLRGLNRSRVPVEPGRVLAIKCAQEAIEIVETFTSRPSVERPSRVDLPHWSVVPFAKRRCVVAIFAEYLRDRC